MFLIRKTDTALVRPIEYVPASAMTPVVGMALKISAGLLTMASGADSPTFISLCERESALTSGDLIPVLRVDGQIEFETICEADLSAVKIGDKLNIDGSTVTAESGGAAEVVYLEKNADGTWTVRVRFN